MKMNKSVTGAKFVAAAGKVYKTWEEGGERALAVLLADEFEIPVSESQRIAGGYSPIRPPQEVDPELALEKKVDSSRMFEELSLQLDGVWPKNILAWYLMKHVFGEGVFEFHIPSESRNLIKQNKICFPALPSDNKGHAVRFGLAAIEAVQIDGLPTHMVKKSLIMRDILGEDIGMELARLFFEARMLFPPVKEVRHVAEMIQRGLNGEEVVLTGAFCPDYSYVETGDPLIPYRYTFDGLSDGVGLVAQQFARVLPELANFFDQIGIRYRIVLAIGDFEGNSPEILRKVGLSQEEFIARCNGSLEAFRQAVPSVKGELDLRLFQRGWANGRWEDYKTESFQRMIKGDFGSIKQNTGKDPMSEIVRFVARTGRRFYEQWYGRDMTESEVVSIVLQQGAEYAAAGRIIKDDFGDSPVIQLAGDRPKMQAFNAMDAKHPTLCTERVY